MAGDNAGIPKLFVNAEPGVIMRDRQRAICRGWPDQTEITVPGKHLVQEDSGAEIDMAIAEWLSHLVGPIHRINEPKATGSERTASGQGRRPAHEASAPPGKPALTLRPEPGTARPPVLQTG